jgi:hypothetical protein
VLLRCASRGHFFSNLGEKAVMKRFGIPPGITPEAHTFAGSSDAA